MNEERARVRQEAQEAEVEEGALRSRLDVIRLGRFRLGQDERNFERIVSGLNCLLRVGWSSSASPTSPHLRQRSHFAGM